jgi:hypothetical protein
MKAAPTMKLAIQFTDSPIDPTEGALAGGTTSGIRMKGMGPLPMLKAATKAMMKKLERIACEVMLNERPSENKLMRPMDARRRGRRPTRCKARSMSARGLHLSRDDTHVNEIEWREGLHTSVVQ